MRVVSLPRFRLVAVIVAVGITSGCMGSFALTKKLYGWNDTVTGNKIINNLIFWGLAILPAYEIAMGVDVIILNTIEFWTGSNLLADAGVAADVTVAVAENADGTVSVTRGDDVFTLVPETADRVRVLKNGILVGVAEQQQDGSIVANDEVGTAFATISAGDVEAALPVIAEVAAR
jgi:hypothetical protein